jgi:hypothetical protein
VVRGVVGQGSAGSWLGGGSGQAAGGRCGVGNDIARRRRRKGRADGRGGTPKNPASSALVHTLYELVQYQITLEP